MCSIHYGHVHKITPMNVLWRFPCIPETLRPGKLTVIYLIFECRVSSVYLSNAERSSTIGLSCLHFYRIVYVIMELIDSIGRMAWTLYRRNSLQ